VGRQPPVGRGLIIVVALYHTQQLHVPSVGLLWTNDRAVAKKAAWQHTTLTRDWHLMSLAGFEPEIPAKETP